MNRRLSLLLLALTLTVALVAARAPASAAATLPADPAFVLTGAVPGYSAAVTVSAGVAYAGIDGALALVDVSDPWRPTTLSSHRLIVHSSYYTSTATSVALLDGLAYVTSKYRFTSCCHTGALEILDVQQPTQPKLLGQLTDEPLNDVAVANGRAYLTSSDFFVTYPTLTIADVSTPSKPTIIGSSASQAGGQGLAISDTIGYVASDDVYMLDISDSENIGLLTTLATPGYARDIQVVGDRAYVADGDAGLQILDLSDPLHPSILGGVDTPGQAVRLRVVGSLVYLVDGDSGVALIDASDPQQPQIYASYDTPGWAGDIDVVGDTLYIADSSAGLLIVRLLDASGLLYLPLAGG